jgi:high-affinity K+ transport system ATPase subunit B
MASYQPPPQPAAQPANDPGRILGIIGLITAIIPCTWFIGLILSIIGFVLSRRAGIKNNLALAGIIVAAACGVISLILNLTGALARMMGGGG